MLPRSVKSRLAGLALAALVVPGSQLAMASSFVHVFAGVTFDEPEPLPEPVPGDPIPPPPTPPCIPILPGSAGARPIATTIPAAVRAFSGLAVPSGFTAGSQTTSLTNSSITYAVLTDGCGGVIVAWYRNSGTYLYGFSQPWSPCDPEPLPLPVPGDPPPTPPLPPPLPILPGVAVPTLSTDTNGSVNSVCVGCDTYYYRDSTRGTLTIREWLTDSTSGIVYQMSVTHDTSTMGNGGC